jgi:hypothetical protein
MRKNTAESCNRRLMLAKAAISVAVAVALSGCVGSAMSTFAPASKTVRYDRGGEVITYALEVKKIEREGTPVRIAGSCESACTLYLGLPNDQVCITPAASFHFHKPYGASSGINRSAAAMMTAQYPYWVNDWLSFQGGLQTQMVVMKYDYARYFMRTCGA